MISLEQPVKRLAIFALGLSFGLIAVLASVHSSWQQQQLAQQNHYGQALTKATAREAVAAAFARDLVSLGAIVQAAAGSEDVLRVAVYNAENQIWVQAGPAIRVLPEQALRFEQPITLENSIAGAVELYLKPRPYQLPLQGLYNLLILGGLGYAAFSLLYHSKLRIRLPQRRRPSPQAQDNAAELNTSEPSAKSTTATDSDVHERFICYEPQSACVALRIKNVSVLQNQLSGAMFRSTFKTFEVKLNNIGALYGADSWRWHNDRYLIEVQAESQEQALFNAACCAKLMLDLCGIIDRVPLDLSAQVGLDENTLESASMPFVGLAIEDCADSLLLLQDRVSLLEYGDTSANCQLIAEFHSPYAELLHKQMQSLKQASKTPAQKQVS
ncbi:hypothetical protein [Agaribacterium haliotis]|uniref:hypothetical protein n=1 Tax=Agaribacterium haliotis TaxID=2013869 RepID=UPI000BB598DF|nr:hypothetical protein [Agaribacterium haliotis]